MDDYKGIYYKHVSKQRFYEGGAHFKYYKLYKILEELSLVQKKRIRRDKLIESREKKSIEKAQNLKKFKENNDNVSAYCII